MTRNNRTPYQREMDQVHLSREKKDETLQRMLQENRKLRDRDARRGGRRQAWLIPAFGAAAAALVLLLTTVLRPAPAHPFGSVRLAGLPMSGARDELRAETFGDGRAQALFPGWTAEAAGHALPRVDAPSGAQETFVIEKDGARLTATVSERETALAAELRDRPAVGEVQLRLNRDGDVLSACFEKNGLYVVLSAGDLAEDAFVQAALAAAGS